MKNNNKNDIWINLFLFFLVVDKPETLLDLIQSDNCEEEFMDIVHRIVNMDSKWFHYSCVEWLINHKDKLFELNKTYKTSQKEFEIVTQDEVKDIEQNFIEKDVLDKIRAEILDEAEYAYADFDRYKEDILYAEPDELPDDDFRYGLRRAIEIIDKYKESKE